MLFEAHGMCANWFYSYMLYLDEYVLCCILLHYNISASLSLSLSHRHCLYLYISEENVVEPNAFPWEFHLKKVPISYGL